jgi:hypothetical protein
MGKNDTRNNWIHFHAISKIGFGNLIMFDKESIYLYSKGI